MVFIKPFLYALWVSRNTHNNNTVRIHRGKKKKNNSYIIYRARSTRIMVYTTQLLSSSYYYYYYIYTSIIIIIIFQNWYTHCFIVAIGFFMCFYCFITITLLSRTYIWLCAEFPVQETIIFITYNPISNRLRFIVYKY